MIYLASPYSSDSKDIEAARYRAVAGYIAMQYRLGLKMYSPIVACHHLSLEHQLPGDAKWWEAFNHDMLKRCDALWVLCLPGWEESRGVKKEIEYAESSGVPINYIADTDGDDPEGKEIQAPLLGP